MPVTYKSELKRPYYAGHKSSYLELVPEHKDALSEREREKKKVGMTHDQELDQMAAAKEEHLKPSAPTPITAPASERRDHYPSATTTTTTTTTATATDTLKVDDYLSAGGSVSGASTPGSPGLSMSRTNSSEGVYGNFDQSFDHEFPVVDRLTMFDILENLALPQRLERMQDAVHNQAEKLRHQRRKLQQRALSSKNVVVEEWRKRVPVAPEEQLDKYRRRMRLSIDRLNKRWRHAKTVTLMEKISFVTACLNILISGYLIGAWPEYFHYWYTAQLVYFMPIRWYKYHKIGFHYFLADLCYFVNMLLVLSIWFFPQSKRLLISTYCLAFGNNAVAIVMWRNSLVFHSLDKTTTLFIHIMPCATLHVLVHLIPKQMQLEQFPAIHTIKYSAPDAPEHYTLKDMVIWATLPYAIWQISYHFLITVRKRAKIAAGRPTSFTWLRKSYAGNFLGKFVLSFPDAYQETVFMFIQYFYALLTMLPCPLWFWYRWASAAFMMVVFTWSSWNGATYYIDVFGKRMEKELEQLRKEVGRMAKSPEIGGQEFVSPMASPSGPTGDSNAAGLSSALDLGPPADASVPRSNDGGLHSRNKSMDGALDTATISANLDANDTTTTSATPNSELKRTVDGGEALDNDTHSPVTTDHKKNA